VGSKVRVVADQTNASIIHHIIHSKLRESRSMNGTPDPSDSSSFGHHASYSNRRICSVTVFSNGKDS
jgi:hypothetical protein